MMVTIFIEYFYWHFGVAPFEIFKIMKNYQIAVWHKFLIARHFQTLFSPWHRQNASDFWSRKKTFVDKISNVVIDTYIRLIAAGLGFHIMIFDFEKSAIYKAVLFFHVFPAGGLKFCRILFFVLGSFPIGLC